MARVKACLCSVSNVCLFLASTFGFAFSRLARNLTGMNGKDLFELSKQALDGLTDESESAKLYALLAQQKQLSGVSDAFLPNTRDRRTFFLQYQSVDKFETSPRLNNSIFGSLRASTIHDADGTYSFSADSLEHRFVLQIVSPSEGTTH